MKPLKKMLKTELISEIRRLRKFIKKEGDAYSKAMAHADNKRFMEKQADMMKGKSLF